MNIKVMTEDGYELEGTLYESPDARAVVVINPGTATKTIFYDAFARFLSGHGYHVFLWNYRGFCESRNGSLRNSKIRFTDLGRYDIPAVIEMLKINYPNLPLFCVGHSVGGQQIGLANNHNKLDGLIAIAVSGGYFFNMPLGYRLKALAFFKVIVPLFDVLFGYVPAGKLNLMEDLPSLLAKEWGRWCSEPEYLFSKKVVGVTLPEHTYKDIDFPVYVLVADDDEISTSKNVQNFWQNVRSSKQIEFKTYKSIQFSQGKIGHFGYFKKVNRDIWEDVLDLLRGMELQIEIGPDSSI